MKALERFQKEVVQLKRKGHLSTASHTTQELRRLYNKAKAVVRSSR